MDPKIVALLASAGRSVDSFPADFKLGLLTNKVRPAAAQGRDQSGEGGVRVSCAGLIMGQGGRFVCRPYERLGRPLGACYPPPYTAQVGLCRPSFATGPPAVRPLTRLELLPARACMHACTGVQVTPEILARYFGMEGNFFARLVWGIDGACVRVYAARYICAMHATAGAPEDAFMHAGRQAAGTRRAMWVLGGSAPRQGHTPS